jgi:hypothetical protein
LNGGAGNDVFNYGTVALLTADTIDGGANTDAINFTATAATVTVTDITSGVTNVEKITTVANSAVISITLTAAQTAGFTTIDLSGDTDATGVNVISSTGANGISTIIGSAGIDTITLGAAAPDTTITGGEGVDVIDLDAAHAGDMTIVVGTLAANADTIANFVTTQDSIALPASLTFTTGNLVMDAYIAADAAGADAAAKKVADIAAITAAAGTDKDVYRFDNTNGLSLAQIETALAAGSAASGEAIILVDDGTDTNIYLDSAVQTDAGSGAGLILIGTLTGIIGSGFATGDFVSL